MNARGPALAVCGSGIAGAAAFSCALRREHDVDLVLPAEGSRGDLAMLTQQVLRRAGIAARDLRHVLVDRGPGSYVGLRVAVTFARCLAAFGGAELLACDSLAAAAAAAVRADPSLRQHRLWPMIDGRQGRVQCSAWSIDAAGALAMVAGAAVAADGDALRLLRRGDVVLADAAVAARLDGGVAATGARLLPLPRLHADALFAAELAATPVEPAELQPHYLTGSYVG